MKLVVDSGSTKTDWGFFNTAYDLRSVKTQGINPCHQSVEAISTINGMPLTNKPTAKGIYIHNGIKVVIK